MNPEVAAKNLAATYFQLGMAVPGAQRLEDPAFEGCVGPIDHAVCNFATNLRIDPWAVRRLYRIATERPAFKVYLLPGNEPCYANELLERRRFELHYRLDQMTAEGSNQRGIDIEPADGQSRSVAARFMCEQFLARQSSSRKRIVAESIAAASRLELYIVTINAKIAAAAMLYREDGVCGLYNLCVASPFRGRGIGAGFVRTVLSHCHERGETVVLQCDSKLQPWYRRFGFAGAGAVEVYSLAKGLPIDIMEVV